VEKPITPVLPGAPVPGGPNSRQRWISILAAVALAVVGAIVVLAWPDGGESPANPNAAESADGTLGTAPGAAATGTAPSRATASPGASGAGAAASAGASPGLSATEGAGPTDQSGSFEVSSRITRGLLGTSVAITVRNAGAAAAVWHSVTLKTTGSGVSTSESSVSYSRQGGEDCFVPSNGNLDAGASITFTVSVSGLLPDVTKTLLDTPPCPA
jgi:hypothetical protein